MSRTLQRLNGYVTVPY